MSIITGKIRLTDRTCCSTAVAVLFTRFSMIESFYKQTFLCYLATTNVACEINFLAALRSAHNVPCS